MKFIFRAMLSLALLAMLSACGGGGGSSSSGDSGTTITEGEDAPVSVSVDAYYGEGKSARSAIPTYYACYSNDSENVGIQAGNDCDRDGAVTAYLTPSEFRIAIKRLALIDSDGDYVNLIADTGSLSSSEVLDLSSSVTLDISEIPQATYRYIYAEIYYYDLTMPIYDDDDPQQIRIYLSDDDFPSEGSLGNHQGDVKMLASDDTYKFVPAGQAWVDGLLDAVRPADIGGASSDDPQTGHDRGLYGDDSLWNKTSFMQGADQDIYMLTQSLGSVAIGADGGSITITFDLTDTWFFEDFNFNGLFEPCVGSDTDEACSDGAEWTPLLPGIEFTLD